MPRRDGGTAAGVSKNYYLIDRNVSIAILLQIRVVRRIGATESVAELQKQQKNGGSSCCFLLVQPSPAWLKPPPMPKVVTDTPIPAVVCCFADLESKNINRLILIAPCLARARRPLRPRQRPLCFRRPKRHRRRVFAENEIPFSFAGATVPAPAEIVARPAGNGLTSWPTTGRINRHGAQF